MNMLVLAGTLTTVQSQEYPMGTCSPQKACDFLEGMHQPCLGQCPGVDSFCVQPIPGAPGCQPIELLCTPEENCVLDGTTLEATIGPVRHNGINRKVTMTNVVIQNSPFVTGYPAAPEPLLEMGSLGHFVGNKVTFQNTPTAKATATGSGCVLNNQGDFSCTDCAFRNCSRIGTGGGVTVGPKGTQVLVNPKFENCLGGRIDAIDLHKLGFGDGCYCAKPDAADCVGCACKQGSAGGAPGWYCDNDDVLSSEQALV